MPSARDKLITDNMRLVYHMYGKIGDGPIKENYKEDIISEGMLGLCKAADTFDESRGVRFSTYAAMCIRNAMLMFIRKTKKAFSAGSFAIRDGRKRCRWQRTYFGGHYRRREAERR